MRQLQPRAIWPIHLVVLFWSANAIANVTFVDLIAKNYQGPDSELSGFSLSEVGLNCTSSNVYSGGTAAVSWELKGIQNKPDGKHFLVKSFNIHFRIKDRKGVVRHEETFAYSDSERGGHSKKQFVNREHDRCDRDYVSFNKEIDFSHTTVEYWVSKIQWMPYEVQRDEPDKIAFSLKDQLDAVNKVKKNADDKSQKLIAKFTRPTSAKANVELRSGLEAFLLDKGSYTDSIRTTGDAWLSSVKTACADFDSYDVEGAIKSGKNILRTAVDKDCINGGCIALFTSGVYYPNPAANPGAGGDQTNPNDVCQFSEGLVSVQSCETQLFVENCAKLPVKCDRIIPETCRTQLPRAGESLFILHWVSPQSGEKRTKIKLDSIVY